jgi:GNAT superfamily N-acetyltransferase
MNLLYEVGNLSQRENASVEEANKQYLLEAIPAGQFISWVAETGSVIAGISGLLIYKRPPVEGNLSGLEGYIMNMYTVPQYRGQGIALLLLTTIIDYVKSSGANVVLLHAAKDVQPLYRKCGFRETHKEMELLLSKTPAS